MRTKIETELSPEEQRAFFKRCAQTPGGRKLAVIQKIAAEFGVSISLMSATATRDGPLSEYLEELKATATMAESVAELAKNGVGLSDGAASAFAAKVFDAARKIEAEDIGTERANNVSLAIARLRVGDQRARFLEAKLREMERAQTEWEEKRRLVAAQIQRAQTAAPASADEVRAAAVAEIDRIMGITPKAA